MNILKIVIPILLLLIITAVTVKVHPGLPEPMIIEDADFEVVEYTQDIQPVTVAIQDEKVQTAEPETVQYEAPVNKTVVVETPQPKVQTVRTVYQQPEPKKVVVKTTTNPQDNSHQELLQKVLKNAQKSDVQTYEKPQSKPVQVKVEQPKAQPVVKPVEQQKPKVTVQPVKTSSNPYMTEEEEIIAWNVWRSNIQNQIMKDSNIGFSPLGTVYRFSFIVDKFGNVSNIKVEVSPSQFIDIARNGVKPAISKLQNKPILNFPLGTRRTSTIVEGSFTVSTTNRYSTPKEYSDYERVVH